MNPQQRAFAAMAQRKAGNAGSYPFPASQARADWDNFARNLDPNVVPTQSYLRVEADAITSTSAITFDLAANTGTQRITENRLQINDAFIASHIFIGLTFRVTAEAESSKRILSYPNDKLFTAGASVNAARAFFFNSKASVRMNDTILIDSLDTLSFMRVDTAQAGTAVSAVATTGVVGSDFWGQDSAFKSLQPNLTFNGSARNQITVTLPESVNFTTAASTVGAVCILRGWLLQNGGTLRTNR